MELYQLRCFIEVARYENMTVAAQKMYVSQSSLSKTIQRLEQNLGVQLFDRVGSNIRLNDYGRLLVDSAEQILAKVDSAERMLRQMRSGEGGSVAVGSTLFVYLDELIENFILSNPGISVKTVSGTADSLQQLLLSGSIDLIISTYPFQIPEFHEIELFKEPMGVCMTPEHPLAASESVSINDLRNENFIVNNPSSDKGNQTLRVCEAAGFKPNIIFEGMIPRTCGALVASGRGVMIICKSRFSYMQMKYHEEYGGLIHRDLCDTGPERVTKITLPRKVATTMAVERFVKYAADYGYEAFCGRLKGDFEH